MRFIKNLFLLLAILILPCAPSSAIAQAINQSGLDNKAEAERLWELAIKAKGGRERLHSVNDVHMSSHEKYWWAFRILTVNYEGLFVFPHKSWEWDDQRGTVFGFSIRVHNFDSNIHQSYVDGDKGGSVVPIMKPSLYNLTKLQLQLLAETNWVKPRPVGARVGKESGRDADIVETRVNELPAAEQKVEFVLDRRSHLPVHVIYYWTRNGRETSGSVELRDYLEVNGIQIPGKVGRVRSKYELNVPYDERVFDLPPSRDKGITAWKK